MDQSENLRILVLILVLTALFFALYLSLLVLSALD